MAKILIPIDTIKDEFHDFLKTEGNSRVFFSGKFGIGKTYFLNEFFQKAHIEDYETFHLFPINYQISPNEDIVELVKYDLLAELLKKDEDIISGNTVEGIKESSLLFYSWCNHRFTTNSILSGLLSVTSLTSELPLDPSLGIFSKLGKSLQDLLALDKEFQKFKKEYQEGEKGQTGKYLNELRSKNIKEEDYISHLLKEKINLLKGTKKSILVLDDLDRMDPEHIFRILNILSAYFEKEQENKFGFDYIMIVADYSNLRSIFQHKYGIYADYEGYMDKFFSITPYYFDNKKAILDLVDEIAKNVKNEEPSLANAIGTGGYIQLFLRYIFAKTVELEAINFRQLFKSTKYQLTDFRKGSFYQDPFEDNFHKIFDKAIKVAIFSFSGIVPFLDTLTKIKAATAPDKPKINMPFDIYITAMLASFGKKIIEEQEQTIAWEGYQIKSGQSTLNNLEVKNGNKEVLFIDLLIKYIESKKFQKNNNQEYES